MEMKKAKKIRASILGLLTKQRNSFNEQLSSINNSAMSIMLQLIDDYHKRHNAITEHILELSVDEKEDDDACEKEAAFTTAYIELKTKLMDLIEEKKADLNSTLNSGSPANQPVRAVRLPKLELPRFSGKYCDWVDFKNEFESMIINDTSLNDVDRFRFLKSALNDGPKRIISNMEVTASNFSKAWQALKDRFDHEALIFGSHINEIISMQGVSGGGPQAYRDLIDKVQAHYRSLLSLGSAEAVAENLMISLILGKIDIKAQSKWEEHTTENIATWTSFTSFFEKYAAAQERVDQTRKQGVKSQVVDKRPQYGKKSHTTLVASLHDSKCFKCQSNTHVLKDCPTFLALTPKDRSEEVRKMNACVACLQSGHSYRFCKGRCEKCSRKHHTLLHFENTQPVVELPSSTSQRSFFASQSFENEQVLLASVIVNVFDGNGSATPCHALLDCGSTDHYISERFAKIINAKRFKCDTLIGGIGSIGVSSKGLCKLTFGSVINDAERFVIHASILQKITESYPPLAFSISEWKIPSHVKLADPNFNRPKHVDLLIGGGLFWKLLTGEQYSLGPDLPYLCNTKLGYIVVGSITSSPTPLRRALYSSRAAIDNLESLKQLVERAFEVESCIKYKFGSLLSPTDKAVEEHYELTTRRGNFGRYTVRLPFCGNPILLGDSLDIATRRFQALERKLEKHPLMKQMYSEFIDEYERLGHLEVVPNFDASTTHFFMPHHPVFKMSSSSTKIRVVFDASCKTSNGVSLNDLLYTGPKLQDDLMIILLRFRLFPYVITADIQQMYRQVLVDQADTNFQLILWRKEKKDPLKVLRLLTVTYGTAPGAYLAIKTLHKLGMDEAEHFPVGAKLLKENFYVDDAMLGANSIEELIEGRRQLVEILERGGFKLTKFCSNVESTIADIPLEFREKFVQIGDHNTIKTLGLTWQPGADIFRCTYNENEATSIITKRVVLSEVARLFDPIGFICPVVTLAKIFFQDLWRRKFDWDTPLPDDLVTRWNGFRSDLTALNNISLPRYVLGHNSYDLLHLHGFCDASQKGYGACVYTWCLNSTGKITVRLLVAKSRLAPTKTLTIARLELCAARLLVDLIERLKIEVFRDIAIDEIKYWTDSTIVLSWLHEEPYKWNTFVAHRVTHIQEVTRFDQWKHIPGELNPADFISRGMLPTEITESSLWWNGPAFLRQAITEWPEEFKLPKSNTTGLEELRPSKYVLAAFIKVDITQSMLYSRNFRGIRRAFAYALRFIEKCHKRNRIPGTRQWQILSRPNIRNFIKHPSLEEEVHAEEVFIKAIQQSSFALEYSLLEKGQSVNKGSALEALAPFIDEKGIIRVGGRIKKAEIAFDAKHQILLPKTHRFTSSVISYFHHYRVCHAGPQMVLSAVRNRYWPIGGLQLTRTIVSKCIWCFRMHPKLISQFMGSLPVDRVLPLQHKAFMVTGVDFAGPISVRHHIRCKQNKEVHLALFVCFTTKAVHIELVPDRSTEAFLRALKRFISDRGRVSKMYSDNATNFVGASNYFKELKANMEKDSEIIEREFSKEFIEWSFIPPRAAHHGGLWESSIKIMKRLIHNIVGCMELTEDELRTVAKQAGAIMNSRPITPMSADPNDLEPLTPGHFLCGGPPTAIPELPVLPKNPNSLNLAQRMRYSEQQLWDRFYKEYLQTLQPRSKWRFKNNNVEIGDMVLMKLDNLDPLRWPLGRIIEAMPDSEGVVRVVKVRTKRGEYKRGITQLALLPNQDCSLSLTAQ